MKIVSSKIFGGGKNFRANRYGISFDVMRNIAVRIRDFDLVHTNGFWGMPTVVAISLSEIFGKPLIISPRGTLEERSLKEKRLKKRIVLSLGIRALLKRVDRFHYITKMEEDFSPKWAKNIRSFIVPNPVEITTERKIENSFKGKYSIKNDDLLVGFFGRIHQRKGIEILLDALCIANKTRGDKKEKKLLLLIVGPDENNYKANIVKRAKELCVLNNLIFTGNLSDDDLADAYSAIDLLALSSHGENFGNVIVEAALHGKPSFVSDQVGLKDWVAENNIGKVLPLDAEIWARELGKLKRDEIRKQWDPERLKRIAKESFSIESVAKQMLQHYEEVIEEHRKI